jgi:peptidylamidoglycolate lyase
MTTDLDRDRVTRTSSPYSVVHGWPRLPDDLSFGQVTGVDVDAENRVFVCHRAENNQFYASSDRFEVLSSPVVACFDGDDGRFLFTWGGGIFRAPHGLAVDPAGRVWITDTHRHQVLVFTSDGEMLQTYGVRDTPGADSAHFDGPTATAFGADGCTYVSDGYGNSRVVKLDPDGGFVCAWGQAGDGPGDLKTPHGITVGPDGLVYVAARGNSSIQVFTSSGEFVTMWRSAELGRPWGLAAGPDNAMYVVDGGDGSGPPSARNKILKTDLAGVVLATWSRFGNYDGQVCWAHDVAVGRDGAVYVGDVYCGMRVQKFVPADLAVAG